MELILTSPERRALGRVVKMLDLKPGSFALSLLFGVAGLGSAIGLAAVSAWLIARASQMPPVLYLQVAATSVRMFGVSRALLRYVQRLASHKVALEGMDSLRLNVYDRLVKGPIERVAALQRGDLLSRVGQDIDAVGDYVVKALLPFLVAAIVGVGTVAGFALLSIPAAIIVAIGLLVSGLVAPLLTARAARIAEMEEQQARLDLAVTTLNVLENADELSVDGRLQTTYQHLDRVSANINQSRSKAAKPAAFAAALDKFAMGATVIGVMIVAIPETTAGMVAAVALAVLVLTPLAAFEGTSELGAASVQMIRSAQASQRILDLIGPETTEDLEAHNIPVEAHPQLEAKDLSVGWQGRPVALEGVNLELAQGQIVGVVGPSGIGKSTLLYTLAGMIEPKAGAAYLNSAPIWRGNREEVTKQVSLTTEDAHVFATTVLENLRVARGDLTREEGTSLLDAVGLGEWVSGLPLGLDTLLGPGATSISGGERRRLLLARALASPAKLLLLDEPGEHLDPETADRVLQTLFTGHGQDRGLVVVTHRLSTLKQVDKVLYLERSAEKGQPAFVGAQGSHEELAATVPAYRWALDQE